MVKDMLDAIDQFIEQEDTRLSVRSDRHLTYFGDMSRLLTWWRENAADVYKVSQKVAGVNSDAFKRIPPKALIGRLRQISRCEDYIGKCGKDGVQSVMPVAIKPSVDKHAESQKKAAAKAAAKVKAKAAKAKAKAQGDQPDQPEQSLSLADDSAQGDSRQAYAQTMGSCAAAAFKAIFNDH
eukprot:9472203-Pyramimonas_sp.AAC.1